MPGRRMQALMWFNKSEEVGNHEPSSYAINKQ